jgi:hypothetical protein
MKLKNGQAFVPPVLKVKPLEKQIIENEIK